jgi:hypothetical protein
MTMAPQHRTLVGIGLAFLVALLVWVLPAGGPKPPADPRSSESNGDVGGSLPSLSARWSSSTVATTPSLLTVTLSSRTGIPNESAYLLSVKSGARSIDCVVSVDAGHVRASLQDPDPKKPESVDASRASDSEVHVRLFGLRPAAYTVGARRLDPGEPFLFSVPMEVVYPAERSVRLSLGVRAEEGQLVVSLKGPLLLTSAYVRVRDGEGRVVARGTIHAPRSGSSGEISGVVVVPAEETLVVEMPSYEPGSGVLGSPDPQPVVVQRGGLRRLSFTVPSSVRVSVSACDENGESVPFLMSVWNLPPYNRPRLLRIAGSVQATGGHRVWELRLPPGRYAIRAMPKSNSSAGWSEVSVGDSDVDVVVSVAAVGLRAHLSLVDDGGTPLDGVRLNLNRVSTTLHDDLSIIAMTDMEGRVVTPPIPAGTYRLMLWDLKLAREVAIYSEDEAEIRLPPKSDGQAEVRGVVRGPGGPVRFTRVYLARGDRWAHTTPTGTSGAFEFTGLPAGSYRVFVAPSWSSLPPRVGGELLVAVGARSIQNVVVDVQSE